MVTREEPVAKPLEVFQSKPLAGAAKNMARIWSGGADGAEIMNQVVAALGGIC